MRENRARSAAPAIAGARRAGGPWRDRGFDPLEWRPPRPRLPPDARAVPSQLDRGVLVRLVAGAILAMVASGAIVLGLLRVGW